MTRAQVASKLRSRRIKTCGAILALQLQPPTPDRDEVIHALREYINLMTTPIDPKQTRGRVV